MNQRALLPCIALLVLACLAVSTNAQGCDSRDTYCETYVCQQNVARQKAILDVYGTKGLRLCNQQQRLGSIKSTCRLNNEIINVGPRMSAVACNPEKVPPALRPLLAPVPATIRAYSNAREIIKEAVANETKEFIKENPQVCGKLTAAACQSFVRRTIVTQPDYKPLLRPTMPTLVDVLTAQLIKQGVFKSETWARAAAQRAIAQGISSIRASGDPHMVGWDGTPFEFMGWDNGVFNIFSETRHQINALLRSYPQPDSDPEEATNTTWMTSLSARFTSDFYVQLDLLVDDEYQLDRVADAEGNLRVNPPTDRPYLKLTVNGNDWSDKIRSDYSEELFVTEDDDVTVFLPSATKGGVEQYDGTLVVITTPDLEIYFTLETEGVLHLDVQVKLRSQDLTMPDGVLGQTVLWQLPEADKQLASGTEGFEVKHGLPGIQCPTCVFVPRLTSDQVAQMRRRLMSAKL